LTLLNRFPRRRNDARAALRTLLVAIPVIAGAVFLATSVLLAMAGTPAAADTPSNPARDNERTWLGKQPGPLDDGDRLLLARVRQAGLWEIPTGQQAQAKADSPVVAEVGAHLAAQHTLLDQQVMELAGRLGVELPSQPTDQQQGWLKELAAAQGPAYDQVFANTLRQAHGAVFSLVAQIRTATRNDQIRDFAGHVLTVVMRHITYLENTGMVHYDQLPAAALPPTPTAVTAVGRVAGHRVYLAAGALAATVLIAIAGIRRAIATR
jgi:predicted outer membrane protein